MLSLAAPGFAAQTSGPWDDATTAASAQSAEVAALPALKPLELKALRVDLPIGAGSTLSPTPSPLLPSYSGLSPTLSPSTPALLGAANTEERQQLDKITALNQIDQQKLVQRLKATNEAREEAAARYNLLFEKQKLEFAPLEAELKRLQLEASVADEKLKKELAELRAQHDRLHAQSELERERLEADRLKSDREKLRMDDAIRDLDFASRKLRQENELAEHKTVAIKADLDLRSKKEEWRKEANRDPDYQREPFKDGILTISDRRIALNGPIVYGVADYVTERIHYFNNKSEELPIFLVIDRSPGGSVMEGYRIVKAIQASKAPIHVVVKSFAASMAATITTLAPRSYAYPNAIILHHQIWSMTFGNPTQQKQQLENINDWNRRLLTPVAKKMGLSLEGLTKQMYEHDVDGDWEEFADKAVAYKWVDQVVHEIRETGMIKEPEDKRAKRPELLFGLSEESDPRGERFVRLPRLQPFDAYFLFNKDSYYR